MKLSPQQEAAVKRSGQDVCVVAGPGSGKTRVLVERFCWLVREQGISPLRILAITFTEKAANQIKVRLAREFATQPQIREQVEKAYISTVHGFCGRLLRENPIAAGVDPEFTVMDAPQSEAELQAAVHEALDRLYRERPGELRALLEAVYVATNSEGRQTDLAGALMDVYDAMRTAGKSVSDLRSQARQQPEGVTLAAFIAELRGLLATAPPALKPKQQECIEALLEWSSRANDIVKSEAYIDQLKVLSEYPGALPRSVLSPDLKQLRDERLPLVKSAVVEELHAPLKGFLLDALDLTDELFRRRKQELGALDFSDLEERAIELLRANPAVLASYQGNFDQILMDELQDTNPLQWTLIDLLRREGRFFAVGDINQSIFGFRHAEPDVFRGYRRQVTESGGTVDELYENYRSRPEILSAVEAVAAHAAGVESHKFIACRTLSGKTKASVEVHAAGDASAEADWIARRILELVGSLPVGEEQRPARFRDVAVLLRTLNALPPLQVAFARWGVPFLPEGGKTFFETREVRDLVLLIRVIANPEDEVALAGVLRSPLVGIGDETLLRMKRAGRLAAVLSELSRLEALPADPEDLARLARFAALLERVRAQREDISPDRLLARAMDECDYAGGLDSRARASVDKFLALVRGWFDRNPQTPEALIRDLDWLRASESEAEAPPDDSSDVVRVMSIHKAKGLEFPIVFLPALQRGVGDNSPAICLSSGGGLGVCWRNPADGGHLPDLTYTRWREQSRDRESGEEDRLLYVAMTRAEEQLVLSSASTANSRGRHWKLVAAGLEPMLAESGASPGLEPVALPHAASTGPDSETLLPRPVLSDQHDSTAAVTSIDLFAQCPRRYYLARYLGWPGREEGSFDPRRRGGPGGAEFGSVVHALLAGVPGTGAPPEALDLVSRFHESELGQRASRAERLEREFDFVMDIEGILLRGQIDLWFVEGGELILVDYKTDHVGPDQAQVRAKAYALQLRLYAMALERFTRRLPNQALVSMLRSGHAAPISLGEAELRHATETVRALRRAQDEQRFDLREWEQCLDCPYYRGLCPAGLVAGLRGSAAANHLLGKGRHEL